MRDVASITVIACLLGLLMRTQQTVEDSGPIDATSPALSIPAAGGEAPPADESTVPNAAPVESSPAPGAAAASQSSVRVILFTATWCALCPAAKEAAAEACETAGVKLVECDVDKYADYARMWGWDRLPQTIVTVGGIERCRYAGKMSATQLVEAIESARQPMGWELNDLKAEIKRHASRRNPQTRWGVNGMTAFEHLTRDHEWPSDLVRNLTVDEQLWLHDATHEGAILP